MRFLVFLMFFWVSLSVGANSDYPSFYPQDILEKDSCRLQKENQFDSLPCTQNFSKGSKLYAYYTLIRFAETGGTFGERQSDIINIRFPRLAYVDLFSKIDGNIYYPYGNSEMVKIEKEHNLKLKSLFGVIYWHIFSYYIGVHAEKSVYKHFSNKSAHSNGRLQSAFPIFYIPEVFKTKEYLEDLKGYVDKCEKLSYQEDLWDKNLFQTLKNFCSFVKNDFKNIGNLETLRHQFAKTCKEDFVACMEGDYGKTHNKNVSLVSKWIESYKDISQLYY